MAMTIVSRTGTSNSAVKFAIACSILVSNLVISHRRVNHKEVTVTETMILTLKDTPGRHLNIILKYNIAQTYIFTLSEEKHAPVSINSANIKLTTIHTNLVHLVTPTYIKKF
jgi:hypothetical protein